MVAPARVTAWGWSLAAAVAAGFVGVLAFKGERPEPGLARFAPAGLLADWPVQQVKSVEISAAAYHRSFRRDPRVAGARKRRTLQPRQSLPSTSIWG